jgi:hydrophobe/amphiphile efflux-1 (HAE1) family protein
MRISDIAIDRPVFTTMLTIAACVLGALALDRLTIDLFPKFNLPIVFITTPYPGASPEEVEAQVSKRIEEAIASVSNVDHVRSTSRDSVSTVMVQFELDTDMRQASSDVRDAVALIRSQLPRDIKEPIVARFDPTAFPVLGYTVSSPRTPLETRDLVDQVVRPALERVEGVGAITIQGGDVREIRVELDAGKLDAVGITIAQVTRVLEGEGFDLPSGRLTIGGRELGLKMAGRFRSPSEIGEVVLSALPDGTQVRVHDVGRVVDSVRERRTLTRTNGVASVGFEVQKQGGSNTVQVVDSVEHALEKLAKTLPPDVKVSKILDGSRFIRVNISSLRETLVLGAVFAVFVIFVFMLDWRSTLISALALPTSVITAFFVMWRLGYSLNVMTMLGLSLSIGLLIDDSVVVRENIFRHMELGEDPITAARKGTAEIALAVTATTFTIVAVFGPIAFMGGQIGQIFEQFGVTIAAAVIVSLLVSFTVDPMLSARLVQKVPENHHELMRKHAVYGPLVRFYDALGVHYRELLEWVLAHRLTVVIGCFALFFGSVSLVSMMGVDFFGRTDQGIFTTVLELPAGTPLAESDRVAREVEGFLRELPEARTVASVVGFREQVNKSSLRTTLTPKNERKRTIGEIMQLVRDRLDAMPGVTYTLREVGIASEDQSDAMNAPILLDVRGPDFVQLTDFAERVFALVKRTEGVKDPDLSYRPGPPEQRLVLDRTRAGDHAVPFAAAAVTLRSALEGELVGRYRDGERDVDVRVQLRPADRDSLDKLGSLSVMSQRAKPVYLREIANVSEGASPATIERGDRQRQITISAQTDGRSLGDVTHDIEQGLERMQKVPGYTVRWGGEAEQMEDTKKNLGLALALAVFFIYFVLASQFESFIHPFTIMVSLPMAIVGAFSALFLFDLALSMAAMIGVILLMGLVTKNAILLVDCTTQLRNQGLTIHEALLTAGETRLRPILMTSAAMVLGMLPAALGHDEGSEFFSPMAIAVIGGVITSTFLTLLVVPVVYTWLDRLTWRSLRSTAKAALDPRRASQADTTSPQPAARETSPEPSRAFERGRSGESLLP